jgi:hypothetical protein
LQGGSARSPALPTNRKNTIINPARMARLKPSGSFSLTITFYYVKKPKRRRASGSNSGRRDSAGNVIQGGNPNPQRAIHRKDNKCH